MTPAPLPRVVIWLLRAAIPDRDLTIVQADLEDEYSAVQSARASVPARWWLARETLSPIAAYLFAPIARLKGWTPMWARDFRLVFRGLQRRPFAALGAAAMLSCGLLAVLVTTGLSSTLLFHPVSAAHGGTLRRVAAVDRQGAHVVPDAEAESSADVAIVNETLAERLWPRADALGQSLYLVADAKAIRVVGVARDSKYRALSESSHPHIYRPTPPTLGLAPLARTSGDPYVALGAIQRTLDGVGPGLVGFFPRTLDDHLAIELLPTRAAASAATALGIVALMLSAVGLYGLVAWFVELRRREIGVRMALGATAGSVRALVIRQALWTAVPGIAAGLLLASMLAIVARSALFGVQPLDPVAFGAGVVALGTVVVLASYVPSRRATGVDPAVALRQ